jgi:hypothetical protein
MLLKFNSRSVGGSPAFAKLLVHIAATVISAAKIVIVNSVRLLFIVLL